MSRIQTYKVRRTLANGSYEWLGCDDHGFPVWHELAMDAFPYFDKGDASLVREECRILNDDTNVIFHAVVQL